MAKTKLDPGTRYALACLRHFLGITKSKEEPLGARYEINQAEAEKICAAVHDTLARAGAAKRGRWKAKSLVSVERLRESYQRRGLKPDERWLGDEETRLA
jgi:hypothetical protein